MRYVPHPIVQRRKHLWWRETVKKVKHNEDERWLQVQQRNTSHTGWFSISPTEQEVASSASLLYGTPEESSSCLNCINVCETYYCVHFWIPHWWSSKQWNEGNGHSITTIIYYLHFDSTFGHRFVQQKQSQVQRSELAFLGHRISQQF